MTPPLETKSISVSHDDDVETAIIQSIIEQSRRNQITTPIFNREEKILPRKNDIETTFTQAVS